MNKNFLLISLAVVGLAIAFLLGKGNNLKLNTSSPQEPIPTNTVIPTPRELEPTLIPEETTARVNPDLILLNLKTDINSNQNATNVLLTAVNNNSNEACSSIIAKEATRDHLYYLLESFYNSKVNEYGQYRESIPGIDNSLNALQNTLQMVKDQCAAVVNKSRYISEY